jgi:hypothetical protein
MSVVGQFQPAQSRGLAFTATYRTATVRVRSREKIGQGTDSLTVAARQRSLDMRSSF